MQVKAWRLSIAPAMTTMPSILLQSSNTYKNPIFKTMKISKEAINLQYVTYTYN